MPEYMAFGLYISAFCWYMILEHTPYISGVQTECSMSVFIKLSLMNTIMIVFDIEIGFFVWSLSGSLGLKQNENYTQYFSSC